METPLRQRVMAAAKESISDEAQGQGFHLHEDFDDTGPVGCIQ